jgi:hypothetical protein
MQMRRDGKGGAMNKVKNEQQSGTTKTASDNNCTALHMPSPDGKVHVVVINALKVFIMKDGDSWFAQGLDIDYASQGASVDDAKKNFEDGLAGTIHQHLKAYNNLSKLLKPAPPEVWQETLYAPFASQNNLANKYYQISVHPMAANEAMKFAQFQNIEYYVEILEQAA